MLKLFKFSVFLIAILYISYEINFNLLVDSFSKYEFISLLPALIISFIGYFILSLRWRFLLKNRVSLKASLESSLICLALNNITPAKLGEVAKVLYLQKFYNLNISSTFSLMITERLFDVIMILIFFAIASFYIETLNFWIIFTIGISGLLLFIYFLNKPKLFLRLIIKYSPKKIKNFLANSSKNVFRISKYDWFIVMLYTVILWFSYYCFIFSLEFFATNFDLNSLKILIVFIFFIIGMSIPSTPGGLGVTQAGMIFALSLFNISKEDALSFSIITHMLQYIPTTLSGLYIISKKNFKFKNKKL